MGGVSIRQLHAPGAVPPRSPARVAVVRTYTNRQMQSVRGEFSHATTCGMLAARQSAAGRYAPLPRVIGWHPAVLDESMPRVLQTALRRLANATRVARLFAAQLPKKADRVNGVRFHLPALL